MFKLKQINKLDLKPFKKQDYVNKHPHQIGIFLYQHQNYFKIK